PAGGGRGGAGGGSLARALDVGRDGSAVVRFRDARSGREVRVGAGELHDRGLGLHVGPYDALLFDVGIVTDEGSPPVAVDRVESEVAAKPPVSRPRSTTKRPPTRPRVR